MTYGVNNWILKTLINHDKQHGANLNQVVRTHQHCQLVKFFTYRTDNDPHARITGRISDPSHWIDVAFDVAETDNQERAWFDVPGEALTSHLRAIFLTKAFKFDLVDPLPGEPPRIRLNLLKWEVIAGDRDDTLLFDSAVELGSKDEASDIVKRWYFGLSSPYPDMRKRPNGTPVPAGPPVSGASKGKAATSTKRAPQPAKPKQTNLTPGRIALETFLEPYLRPGCHKTIPDWLFQITLEQKVQLNAIEMFGVDEELSDEADAPLDDEGEMVAGRKQPDGAEENVDVPSSQKLVHISSPPPLDPVESENGAGPSSRRGEPSSPAPEWSPSPRLASFPQPGQPIRRTPTQGEDDQSDDDDNIPVKSPNYRPRREGFDPLGFPSTPAEPMTPSEPASHQASEPVFPTPSDPEPNAEPSTNGHGASPQWSSFVQSEDENLPPSKQSQAPRPTSARTQPPPPTPVTRSTAKRARRSPKPTDPLRARTKEYVLVDASDQSRTKTTDESQSQSQSQSLPNGQRILHHLQHNIPAVPPSIPVDEEAAHADDELSEPEDSAKSPMQPSRAGSTRGRTNGSSGMTRVDPPRRDKGKGRLIEVPNDIGASAHGDYTATPAKRKRDHVYDQAPSSVGTVQATPHPNRPSIHDKPVPTRSGNNSKGLAPVAHVKHHDYASALSDPHAELSTSGTQTRPIGLPVKHQAKVGGFKLNLPLEIPYTAVAVNRMIEKAQAKRQQMAAKRGTL